MSSAQLGAFVEKFRALTLERLVRLNQLFIHWHDDPGDGDCLRDMQRELHNLKGEAKLMNMANVAEVVHRIEDHLAGAPPPGEKRSDLDSRILAGFDLLGALVTQEAGDDLTARWQSYLAKADSGTTGSHPSPWSGDTGRIALRSARTQNRRSLRVDMQKLEAVADTTGDLLLTQGRLTQAIKKLQSLLAKDASPQVTSCLDQARQWLAHQQNDIEKLEATVRDLRLVPLRTVVDTFERTVRDLAYEQGKQVQLVQENTGVGIDSDILERLGEPILQLLLNGVVHGIEAPEVRHRNGKPARGLLRVGVRPGASVVHIDVVDDGAGVQLSRINEMAMRQGLLAPQSAQSVDEEALLDFIFQPGFTTRGDISEVAGRGVGLDAVRAQVGALGGTVNVRSMPGAGTTFTISVPTTMLWVRALLVRWEQQYFAIPADTIVKVVRLDPGANRRDTLRLRDGTITMVRLGEVLELPPSREDARAAIVVHHEKRACALGVHQVMGERQVVQRRLDPGSAHLPFLSGTATLENGSRAGLLNITRVLDDLRHVKPAAAGQPLVLVVDDSELVRDKMTGIFHGMGYRVVTANDGLAALRTIERERPQTVVSDLEMPHLDGLGLLAAVRRQKALKDLPFIIVSAKDTRDLQQQSRPLHVSGWFDKSNLSESALTRLVRRLCTGSEEA